LSCPPRGRVARDAGAPQARRDRERQRVRGADGRGALLFAGPDHQRAVRGGRPVPAQHVTAPPPCVPSSSIPPLAPAGPWPCYPSCAAPCPPTWPCTCPTAPRRRSPCCTPCPLAAAWWPWAATAPCTAGCPR